MTIILGIDPGSRITGYGLVKEHAINKLEYIDSGCIRTSEGALSDRLLQIFSGVCKILEKFNPDLAAIEEVFMHQNARSALKLGHARGVAMVACASNRVDVSEYSPRSIKQAVVGYGAAEKDQVNHMVMKLLDLKKAPQSDAADALAIAICHSHMRQGLTLTKRRTRSTRRWKI
jgi:crossover junction endodeoxyribonuclease RuvC